MTGISLKQDLVRDSSDLADILADLVIRGRLTIGVTKSFIGLPFSASGDDGQVDILLLFLPRPLTLPSCPALLTPRFFTVTLPSLGVPLRRERVVMIVCDSSGFSSVEVVSERNELKRVLRRCGVVVDELDRFKRGFVILRGEFSLRAPGVGVELVMSFKGDFSRPRAGLNNSIFSIYLSLNKVFPFILLLQCWLLTRMMTLKSVDVAKIG